VPNDERVVQSAEGLDPQISKLAEISREMVRLYKVQFGRGPTRARSDFAGPDLVVCTLEDSLTPAEKRMAAMGDHQRLRDLRLYFQHATEDSSARSSNGFWGARYGPLSAAWTPTKTSPPSSSTSRVEQGRGGSRRACGYLAPTLGFEPTHRGRGAGALLTQRDTQSG
jgi:Na+-translocating membrane potential-generating system (MpsC)